MDREETQEMARLIHKYVKNIAEKLKEDPEDIYLSIDGSYKTVWPVIVERHCSDTYDINNIDGFDITISER